MRSLRRRGSNANQPREPSTPALGRERMCAYVRIVARKATQSLNPFMRLYITLHASINCPSRRRTRLFQKANFQITDKRPTVTMSVTFPVSGLPDLLPRRWFALASPKSGAVARCFIYRALVVSSRAFALRIGAAMPVIIQRSRCNS